MLEELYRTDRQGRDAILQILFQTPSFVPDERFLRFVVARLGEEDIYVSNSIIDTFMHYERLPNGEPGRLNGFNGAHHDAWIFIDAHFEAFEPLLREQIGKTKSMWTLWGTAWLFKKCGILPKHAAKYTPEVLALVAGNLRSDNIEGNASQATRLFLILSDQGLPILRQAAKSPDTQQRSLAQALIDALAGSRAGFGFLNSKVWLKTTPFGPEVEEPEWLSPATEPYRDEESYP
jgi:hypothetical protein